MFHTHCHNLHSTEVLAWRRSHLKKLIHICWLQSLFFSTHQHFQIFVFWKWFWRKRGSCSNVIVKAPVQILQERKKTCSTFLKCIWPEEIPRNLLNRLGEHTFWMIWLSAKFITMLEPVQASLNILHNAYHTPTIADLKMRGSGAWRAVSQAFFPLKCLRQLNLPPASLSQSKWFQLH